MNSTTEREDTRGTVPATTSARLSEAELVDYARTRIEKGSRSFAGAARLFAPSVRNDAYLLYAWCRHCDDEIDGQELGFSTARPSQAATEETLARLRAETIAAIEGNPGTPVFQALQQVVTKHAIPASYPLDLIEGMAMDVRGESYRTLGDTQRYCYHVAGCVGVMMAMIMGAKDRLTLQRACDLGLAFQLTNIVRDVSADAAVDRVYLPGDWLAEAGVPQDAVLMAEHAQDVHAVKLRLLDEADRYYASAFYGLGHLPLRSAAAIAAARRVYREIGVVVREAGALGGGRRAKVSSHRKRINVVKAVGDTFAAKVIAPLWPGPARTGLWTLPE